MKIQFKLSYIKLIAPIAIAFFIHGTRAMKLPGGLKMEALSNYKEFNSQVKSDNYLIIIDYRKDVFSRRLWLYDKKNNNVILNTHVTHAFRSGLLYCSESSNVVGSNISSIGSFKTGIPYTGKYGKSMRIHGLEPTNKNTFERAIVFHPNNVKYKGFKIPSWLCYYSNGCFALNDKKLNQIISKTKNGTFLFVKGRND